MSDANDAPASAFSRWRDLAFGIDLEVLAVFRIVLGILFLADVAVWARDLDLHLTDHGVMPLALRARYFADYPSFHALAGSAAFSWALLGIGALPALAFTVGWHTRISGVLVWIFWASLQHRNPIILNGGDEVMRILLFWCLFLPVHARHSLDAVAGRAAAWAEAPRVRNVASTMLLLQVAIIYPITTILKLRYPVWQDLTILDRAMRIDGVATDIGRALLEFPEVLRFLAGSTLLLEAFGLLLVFSPFATRTVRTLGVAAFMSLHGLGIGLAMAIGLFPWVMVAAWIPFLPGRRTPAEAGRAPSPQPAESPRQRAFLVALFIGILIHLAGTLDWVAPKRVDAVTQTLKIVRMDQRWFLWVNVMPNRYYLFPARTSSGRLVDLHRDGAELDWANPRRKTWNTRWWKYLLQLAKPPARVARPALADALARRWDLAHPEDPIQRVELWMRMEDPATRIWRNVLLWSEDDLLQLGPGRHPAGS